jgi:branched-chain amino acid transport system substrate-binding protein
MQIVGDDLHPLAQVRDFAPYIAKIKQSGADTVITGNWGSDLSLLIKAANDAGLNNVKFYTYYGPSPARRRPWAPRRRPRVPGRLRPLQHGRRHGAPGRVQEALQRRPVHHGGLHGLSRCWRSLRAKAKSTDPVKVAAAMEGMKFKSFNGDVEMRKADHQLQQGLYITVWQKADAASTRRPENTGYTLVPVKYYEPTWPARRPVAR